MITLREIVTSFCYSTALMVGSAVGLGYGTSTLLKPEPPTPPEFRGIEELYAGWGVVDYHVPTRREVRFVQMLRDQQYERITEPHGDIIYKGPFYYEITDTNHGDVEYADSSLVKREWWNDIRPGHVSLRKRVIRGDTK